jgi:uncharacterized membrane protein YfcA
MYNFAWDGWTVLAVAAFLIGASKTGFPGVGILAILLTARVIPARLSTGLILPMLVVGDIFAVAYYRRHAVWKHLVKLIPFAALGIVLGWLALGQVKVDQQLRIFIAVVILVMLALNWWRNRRGGDVPIPTGWWFPVCMGLIAGVTTMMANAAGPVMIIYLLAMRLPKTEFLGTGAWYYLILNWFKVPFSGNLGLINWESLQFNLVLLPLIAAGALAGIWLVKYVPEKTFGTIVQVLAVVAAAALLF